MCKKLERKKNGGIEFVVDIIVIELNDHVQFVAICIENDSLHGRAKHRQRPDKIGRTERGCTHKKK